LGEALLDASLTPFSYGYNSAGTSDFTFPAGLGSGKEIRAAQVRVAWDMVAITDSDGTDGTGYDDLIVNPSVGANGPPGTIHFGGTNVLFCDGHVQWYARIDIALPADPSLSDPNVRRISSMWNRDHSPG
jgi:prepilin-type processing-associated H-X9-DG protein